MAVRTPTNLEGKVVLWNYCEHSASKKARHVVFKHALSMWSHECRRTQGAFRIEFSNFLKMTSFRMSVQKCGYKILFTVQQ